MQKEAWSELETEINAEMEQAVQLVYQMAQVSAHANDLQSLITTLQSCIDPGRRDTVTCLRKALRLTVHEKTAERQAVIDWLKTENVKNKERFNSKLFSDTPQSPLYVPVIAAEYADDAG